MNGQGSIVKADRLEEVSKVLKTTESESGVYLILHAIGHNSNMGGTLSCSGDHASNYDPLFHFKGLNNDALVEASGTIFRSIDPEKIATTCDRVAKRDKRIKTMNDVFKKENNPTYKDRLKDRFGDNKPKDNYNRNRTNNKQKKN